MRKTVKMNMRELAALAGVSVMTVSRALKNNPRISQATRERIRALADQHGYRINPLVSAQMANIRARRLVEYEATIGLLIYTPPSGLWIGARKVIDGILETCEDLGFRCDVFDLADTNVRQSNLNRILKSRGIQAVIEAPMIDDLTHYDIDLSDLIVISSNPGTLPQTFHRVCPDHYGNMDMLLRKIYQCGFRRPGLMVPRDIDDRLNHLWSSRFLAFQQTEKLGKIPPYMPHTTSDFSTERFARWLGRHKPDILIVTSQELFDERFFENAGLKIPDNIEVAKININDRNKGFSGIDLMSKEVGRSCVDLLARLMYQNEYGKPDKPISILVPGEWVLGKMCPSFRG
jgi:LacI family transcriptional regulator